MGKSRTIRVLGWLVFVMVVALGWNGKGEVVAYSGSLMEGDYSYYINKSGYVSINGYEGNDKSVVIPEIINGIPVTEICPFTFWKNEIIEYVVIPQGVLEIGYSAFDNCRNLKQVILPDSLQFIGEGAFKFSGIESIVIPVNVEMIEDSAFSESENLKKVIFIGENVKLGYSVFENCTKLEKVTLPSKLQVISPLLFRNCYKMELVELPNSVEVIAYGAFEQCSNIKEIALPNNLKIIEEYAFSRTALSRILIPYNVNEIKMYAFDNCKLMNNIYIAQDTVLIGEYAIPKEVTIYASYGSNAMQYAERYGNSFVKYIVPKKLSFSQSKINLEINGRDSCVIKLNTQPTNASTSFVKWDTSNKKVVTVDTLGKIKAVGNGIATIIVKTTDGTNLLASCTISVTTNVSSVKLQKSKITLDLSNKKQDKLFYSYAPSNATNTKVTWTSSNKSVAIVSNNGVVTAKGVGKATIRMSIDGKTASCEVTVNPKSVVMFTSPSQRTITISLKWNKVEGISGYRLYRYDSSAKKDILIYQFASNKTTYKVTRINGTKGKRLSAGKNITYRIQTYRIVNGITYYSNKKTLSTGTKPNTPVISKLSNIKVANKRGIKVSWKKISGASAYEIYMSTNKTKNFKKMAIVNGNKYNTLNLIKGKKYYFKIRAISSNKIYSSLSKVRYLKVK